MFVFSPPHRPVNKHTDTDDKNIIWLSGSIIIGTCVNLLPSYFTVLIVEKIKTGVQPET